MRLRWTLLAAVPVLTATSLPAWSATISISGVSGVTIAWTSPAHTGIKISWTETTPAANSIKLTAPGFTTELATTAAGDPDEAVIPVPLPRFTASEDPADKSAFIVSADGQGEARSVFFDRYVPTGKTPAMAFGSADTLRITGSATTGTDATPNDPLDLTTPVRWRQSMLVQRSSAGDCGGKVWPVSTSPVLTIQAPPTPIVPMVLPTNEWGTASTQTSGYGSMTTAGVKTSAPTTARRKATWTLTGELLQKHLYYTPWNGDCGMEYQNSTGRTVVLQARKSSTDAWASVTSTKTVNDKFTLKATHWYTRQYRVVVPNRVTGGTADHGVASGYRTVKAT